MKKVYPLLKAITGVFFTMMFTLTAMSQTLIPFSGSNTINSNGTLCSHAGCGATYSDYANGYTVLNVTSGNRVQLSGTYNTENCCDYVNIYDGVGTGGTLLASYHGSGTICYTGNFSQTLTVQFVTDGSIVSTGLNATVTYNPSAPTDPTSASASSPVICNGSSTSLTATGAVGTVYWYSGSCGGTLVGTGNPISVNPSSTTTYYARNFNNCVFSVGCASTTITVNAIPTVNAVSSQIKCNGTGTNLLSFTGAVPGTVFNWTNNTTSIGLAASGSGDIASFTALNSGTSPVTATINIAPSYTNGGVTCNGTSGSTTIAVNPSGQVNDPADQVVCHNASTAAVNFTTGNSGGTTTYAWTNNNTAIGLAASGSGNISSFTATNSGTAPVTATITVTPTFTNGGVSCSGTAQTFTITVNPKGQVNSLTAQIFCDGASTTAVNFSSNNTGGTTTYAWTNDKTSIGLSASGTGNISSFTATNSSGIPVVATITVTPTFTNGSASCTGTAQTFTITVNPNPTVNQPANQVLCNNGSSAPVSFGNKVLILASDAFTWLTEVQSKIQATGAFSTVDIMNASLVTPTVAQLQAYQSIFFYAETGYANSTLLGNNLAAYVDGGGGLVMSVFCTASLPVDGAINTSTYQVMVPAGQIQGSTQTLGTVWLPAHQLMTGITSFNGGTSSYRSTSTSLAPGAYRVADWNDGRYLITARDDVGPAHAKRVDLGFFPPSKDSRSDFWDPASDGAKIMKNALIYTGGGGGTFDYSWTNDNTSIGLAASGTGDVPVFTAVNTGSAPVTATITVTPSFTFGGVTCNGASKTFTFTVNPTGQINDPADQVVSNGATTTAVNFTSDNSGGTTTYSWTNNTTSIGLAASGTGNISAFTATNAGTAPVAATITVTPTFTNGATSCSGTAQTFTITVNPAGQVNQPASQVVCANGSVSVNFATTNTGGTTTYSWTNNTTSIGLAASGNGNIASFTAVNSGTVPVVATIIVTPTFTNAGVSTAGATKTFTITVNPAGQVNDPADQVVCNSATTTAVNFATNNTGGTTTYAWTNNTTSIGLAASGTGNISAFTATNAGTAPVTATITVTPTFTNGGTPCSGAPQTFTITVNPSGQVSQPASQVICNNSSVSVNYATTNTGGTTTYAWTNNATSIGLAASGSGNIASFTAVNSGTAPVVATIVVTPTYTNAGVSCSGATKTFTITVNPTGQVNDPADQVVCNSANTTAVNFASTNTGGTTLYSWSNDNSSIGLAANGTGNISAFTATNTGTAPVTATITVVPTFNNASTGCGGGTQNFTITVNPKGQVNTVASQVICAGEPSPAFNFSTNNTGGTTTYAWTNDKTSIGLSASGTGNIASFTPTNSSAIPIVATITVTPTYSNGGTACAGTSTTFTITVNPTPSVNQPADQVVCNNSTSSTVSFGNKILLYAADDHGWIDDVKAKLMATGAFSQIDIMYANSVTPTLAQLQDYQGVMTWTNSGYADATTAGNNFAAYVDGGGGVVCAVFTTASIHIGGNFYTPAYQVMVPAGQNNTGGLTLGTVYLPAHPLMAGVTSFSGGAGFRSTSVSLTPGSYRVADWSDGSFLITAKDNVGPANVKRVDLGMFPPSDDGFPGGGWLPSSSGAIIMKNALQYVAGGGGVFDYNWTNSNPAIGLAASGTGDVPSFTAVNTGTTPITATITVTPSFTNAGVTCTGASKTFTITVNPSGQVNDPTDQVVCNSATTTAVNFATNNTGGTTAYSWTNNNTSIGLAASGTGNIAAFTATNTVTAPVTATITVTPTFTNGATSCSGTAQTFTITVNPTAQVNQPASYTVCNNTAATATNFATVNTGGTTTYAWTNDNTTIGLAASGSGNIASFTAVNTGTSPVTATIVVTPTFTNTGVSCTGASKTFFITVNPTGQVNDPADQVICNSGSTAAVNFATVNTGGTTTYAWTNDNATIGLAASGTGNIASFTATNSGNSPVTATITVTPTFSNAAPGVQEGTEPGIPPSGANCSGPAQTFTITVNPTAQVNPITNKVVCNSDVVPTIYFGTVVSGGATYCTWTNDNTSIGLAASGAAGGWINSFTAVNNGTTPQVATITVTPTFTNGGVTCSGPSVTFTITVNPTAQVNVPANQVKCNTASTDAITFATTNTGGTTVYSWTNNNTSIGLAASGNGDIASFTATNSGTAPVTATITVTPAYTNAGVTCSGPAQTFTITVNPTGQVDQPADLVVCNGAPTAVTYTTANTGGTTTYSWTNTNTTIGLAASGTGNIASFAAVNNTNTPQVATITVTPTFTNGGMSCSGPSKTFTITVNATPTITCPANINVVNDPGVCGATVTYAPATVTGAPTPTVSYSMPSGSLFPIGTTTVTVTATNVCAVVTCSFTVTVRDTELPVITCPSNITVTATGACTKVVNYTVTATDNCPGFTIVRTAGLASGSAFPLGVTTVTHRVTDASGNISTCSFTVTVLDGQIPAISTQPVNTTVCAGSAASFNVASTNVVSYLWQAWNGTGWSDISGSNNAVYTVNNASLNNNTNTYRVTVIGLCNNAISNIATVYVNPNPFVTITASGSPAMIPGQFLTLTANVSISGGTYKWYKNGELMSGVTGDVIDGLTVDNAGTYKVVYTDGNGCTSASAELQITASESTKLFAYPNPNNGEFSVRFYNAAGEQVTLSIYNDRGRLVYQRKYATSAPYTSMEVNMLKEGIMSSGYFMVEVRDHNGKQIAVKTVIVYR